MNKDEPKFKLCQQTTRLLSVLILGLLQTYHTYVMPSKVQRNLKLYMESPLLVPT